MFCINMLMIPTWVWYCAKQLLSWSNTMSLVALQSHAFCKKPLNNIIRVHSCPILAANKERPFIEKVHTMGGEIAGVDFRRSGRNGCQPGRRDWKGWSHGKLRLQLLLIGRFLALQDCQHSSAGVIRFSKGHITLCRENCRTLVFRSEYRRGSEVVSSKNDENKPFPTKTYYLFFREEAKKITLCFWNQYFSFETQTST